MNRRSFFFTLSLLLFFVVKHSFATVENNNNDNDSTEIPKHITLNDYRALLWEISGNGLSEPSFLYGALETSQKLAYHLTDSFFSAFDHADKIVLELHPDSVISALQNPEILKRIFKNRYTTSYEPAFNYYSILSPNIFNQSVFGSILTGTATSGLFGQSRRRSDMEEERSLPDFVFMAALKKRKDVAGLTSYSEQLDLSERTEEFMREDRKKNRNIRQDMSEYFSLLERLLDSYRKGDLGLLDSLYKEMVNVPGYFTEIRDSVNEVIAERIVHQLQEDIPHFILLDALILAGDNGIIEFLRKAGYDLKPVTHYIQTKPNKQIERIERMTRRINLETYVSKTGLWEVRVPDYTIGAADERDDQTFFSDNLNDVLYSVSRFPTNARLSFQSPEYLFQRMDSVIYEYVPGKILRRKDSYIEIPGYDGKGYPMTEIRNRTTRGNLEQFRLIITPLEIIVFKISGQRNYIRKKGIGRRFLRSAKLNLDKLTEWTTVTTGHGEFELTLPSYHLVDTVSNLIFVDPEIEYQAYDPASDSYFLFRRNVHHDLKYLEEDSFDLTMMAETIANDINMEVETSEISFFQNYPSIEFNLWRKDAKDTLNAMLIIRGASHYMLLASSHNEEAKNKFFSGFSFLPFNYNLNADTITDTILAYRVMSPVIKQESDDDDDDYSYYYWYMDDDEEEDDSHLNSTDIATYYFDLGSEYIRVEKNKMHDYQQFNSFKELWNTLIIHATNDSAMIIYDLSKDSTALFPYLDIVVSDTNTIRQIRKKYIIHHGVIFFLTSMTDTITGEQPFTTTFFDTFTPIKDSLIGKSIFDDKGWLFIENFLSDDSTKVKQAVQSLHLVRFFEEHRDSLLRIISDTALMRRSLDVAGTLIEAFGEIETEEYYDDLEKLYPIYNENPLIQATIFRALAYQQHKEARKGILRLMEYDMPLPRNLFKINTLIFPFSDSADLAAILFPKIADYLHYPEYKRLIMRLLEFLSKEEKINLKDYPKVVSMLKEQIKIEIKKDKSLNQDDPADESRRDIYSTSIVFHDKPSNNTEILQLFDEPLRLFDLETSDHEINTNSNLILMVQTLSNSNVEQQWLNDVYDYILTSKNRNNAFALAKHLYSNDIEFHDSIWASFVKNPKMRTDVYRFLDEAEALHLFDSTYHNQLAFAESFINIRRDLVDADSLTFLDKRFIDISGKSGYVYFFKHKSGFGRNRDWVISVVGIQPEDTTMVDPLLDFIRLNVETIYIDDNVDELIDEQLKELRKHNRKRFTHRRHFGGGYSLGFI